MYYYQIRRIFSFFLALFKTFYVYFHIYVLIFSTIFQTIDDGPWEKGVWHLTDCSIKIKRHWIHKSLHNILSYMQVVSYNMCRRFQFLEQSVHKSMVAWPTSVLYIQNKLCRHTIYFWNMQHILKLHVNINISHVDIIIAWRGRSMPLY